VILFISNLVMEDGGKQVHPLMPQLDVEELH
jgi:hypothetical protein